LEVVPSRGARVDAKPESLRPEEASGTQKARYEAAETAASPVEMTEGEKARTKSNGNAKRPATVGGRYKGRKGHRREKDKGEKQIPRAITALPSLEARDKRDDT
jgi:hypothetical protein